MSKKRLLFDALTITIIAFSTFSGLSQAGTQNATPDEAAHKHEASYRAAWQLLNDNYLYAKRLANWKDWQNKFHGKLRNAADVNRAIDAMLKSLGDEFTYIYKADDTVTVSEPCMTWRRLSNNAGYIKIAHFHSSSLLPKMRRALFALQDAPAIIIDLRHNHGGWVELTCRAAGFFVPKGTLASLHGRSKNHEIDTRIVLSEQDLIVFKDGSLSVRPREPLLAGNKPIIVLVNEDTRSAAEMFAGVLRDLRGAIIVGKRTFGKGVAQDVYSLESGDILKFVSARIVLPSGVCIHGKGLVPDYEISSKRKARGQKVDQQLAKAVDLIDRGTGIAASSRGVPIM
ncbi:MAG TPA: S41 family peptidase [Candidatus Obscuribacterales bacterium]